MRHHCTTNISLPYEGELITVTLSVEFEIAYADFSVGIVSDGIDCFTAKVIGADLEDETADSLKALQTYFDANEENYVTEIDEACIASLADYYDPREEP